MNAGDTFQPADGTVDKFVYLWVIISDPEQDSNVYWFSVNGKNELAR